jgi:hypothetical protein
MVPMAPKGMSLREEERGPLPVEPGPWPPYRRIQPARGARIRVRAPPWPPNPIGVLLGVFASKFTNILGLIACNLIALFVIFFHVVNLHGY